MSLCQSHPRTQSHQRSSDRRRQSPPTPPQSPGPPDSPAPLETATPPKIPESDISEVEPMVNVDEDEDEGSAAEDDASVQENGNGNEQDAGEDELLYSRLDSDVEDGVLTDDDFYDLNGTPVVDAIDSDADTDEDVINQDDELYAMSQDRDGIKDMKANGWNYDVEEHNTAAGVYPGLYRGRSGPTDAVTSRVLGRRL
ncbi:hypothetical protein PI124_g21252 [Phytophthora idaei]|nr:hypothetical protein PI125_g21164 [Phytophthora idaei]KAG3129350.1 hypothetical protein PI126_g21013 [Phytophthora idaei]KAG3233676.1 hypothetical protein PI124_g21252 [Phytophthora idaei]